MSAIKFIKDLYGESSEYYLATLAKCQDGSDEVLIESCKGFIENSNLSDKSKEVLFLFYGIGRPRKTLLKIGDMYNVTDSYIWSLKNNALKKLRDNIDVGNLGLSVRVRNCLKRADCTTIEELKSLNLKALKKIRNLGDIGIDEIISALKPLGIKLAP